MFGSADVVILTTRGHEEHGTPQLVLLSLHRVTKQTPLSSRKTNVVL